jgi:hypothetical protein
MTGKHHTTCSIACVQDHGYNWRATTYDCLQHVTDASRIVSATSNTPKHDCRVNYMQLTAGTHIRT